MSGWNSKTWEPLKKIFSVNPHWSHGSLDTKIYRIPAPGSQLKYTPPTSKASDVAQNQYFQRDTRRNYPRLSVYTQNDVAALLAQPVAQASIASPQGEGSNVVAPPVKEITSLTEVLSENPAVYSKSNLPPLPTWGRQYEWRESVDAPIPDEGTYYPVREFY